ESLRLVVSRPQPAPGRYLVADHARLALTAGETSEVAVLNFQVRASQGGPFSFTLPAGVEVRDFTVDGRSVPLRRPDQPGAAPPTLTAPLSAGNHDLGVSWSRDKPLGPVTGTPELDLGLPTANVTATLTLPETRWILWTWGPLQGPAVQFWSLLAVTFLAALFLGRLKNTPLGRSSWFLLSWGLIQLDLIGALAVVGWLLALARRRRKAAQTPFWFNCGQVGLALWTALALALIYLGIKDGLLRNPDMLIAGGGSYGQNLGWFTDRVDGPWPAGRVLSIPVGCYKALMLAWSLWLAGSLIGWLKWGWSAFSADGFWRPKPPRAGRNRSPEAAPPSAENQNEA
ncbi:MAG: hypothetical protein LBV21_06340, partial [Candidatus Adiutrix sp.]|nr:hypothetical protein [Candidatus Adiutrix sp.]